MEIIAANSEHSTQLLNLSNDVFGFDFITNTDLKKFISDANQYIFVAIENNQIAGFITATTCTSDGLSIEILSYTDELDINNCDKFGVIKQVAVNTNYHRRGIANQLLKHCLKEVNTTDVWLCISWYKGEITPMSKLLLKNEFILDQTIPNYWSEESLSKKYNCAICGTPPCTCKAELYSLNKKRS